MAALYMQRGITVVNPRPEQDLRKNQPLELQKLDKIHRVWHTPTLHCIPLCACLCVLCAVLAHSEVISTEHSSS